MASVAPTLSLVLMNRARVLVTSLTAVVNLLAVACAGDDSSPIESSAPDTVDTEWPHDFVEETIGGGLIDANDLEGQDVILWFWAPW
ncbi:MAG: hypothetical protein CL433_01340 [Acidimicrobiaceae bacterium]|jgi:hypothetical protein|nr:hypothetical protein [Acidimicrobiaceae bacterium]